MNVLHIMYWFTGLMFVVTITLLVIQLTFFRRLNAIMKRMDEQAPEFLKVLKRVDEELPEVITDRIKQELPDVLMKRFDQDLPS
jgi:hypothetical protein